MSRTLKDEDLRLNIIVNGNKAQKEIGELETQTRELRETNKSLRLEKSKLNKEDKDYQANLKKLNQGIKENNAVIQKNDARMKELRKEIGLNGLTARQLRQEYNRLKYTLANLTPGTAEWKKVNAEMQLYGNRLNQVRGGAIKTGNSIGNMANKFKWFIGIVTSAIAILTGLVFSMKELIKGLAGMDDAIANVMKTTGLARKDVRELYTEFKYLNTRTARKELLLLAEQAGRLGLSSKKDILSFVEVANQIKVSLGDDLGGEAEVAIREVGKLTNIYKVGEKYGTDFKESMLKMGSAINEVSANSQAQAPFLIETLKRLGGIADQANISAQNVIGYGSALDQLGQREETSATALSKVMLNMFKDVETYASLAKIPTEEFFELLKTDANEALLQVLEGLNGNNEGLTVMSQKLDGLGLDGSRAVQVLASLASNTELIRKEQALANNAMNEGISLTNEYNIKNNNMAGNLEKIGRAFHAYFINSKVNEALEGIVSKFARWFEIKLSDKLEDERVKMNMLVIEMTNANTSAERRNTIYSELKDNYPDIIAGIDAENINLEKLRLNLEKFNQEMIKKIALESANEELQEKNREYGEASGRKASTEINIEKRLLKLKEQMIDTDKERSDKINDVLVSSKSFEDKYLAIQEILRGYEGGQYNLIQGIQYEFGKYLDQKNREKELQDEVNDALGIYTEMYNKIMGDKTGFIGPPTLEEWLKTHKPIDSGGGGGGKKVLRNIHGKTFEEWKLEQDLLWQMQQEYIETNIPDFAPEDQVDDEMTYLMEKYQLTIQGQMDTLQAMYDAGYISQTEFNDKMNALYKEDADNLNKALQQKQQYMFAVGRTIAADLVAFGEAIGQQGMKQSGFLRAMTAFQMAMDQVSAMSQMIRDGAKLGITPIEKTLVIAAGIAKVLAFFGQVKKIFSAAETPQYFSGNYADVIGARDGKKYRARVGSGTGRYSQPTLIPGLGLVGEKQPEIVFSGPDTQKLLNTPGLINAINATLGVRQFAQGNAREIIRESSTVEKTFTDPVLLAALEKLTEKLDQPAIAILEANEDYIDKHNDVMDKYSRFKSKING